MAPTRSPFAGRLLGAYLRGLTLADGSPSAAAAYLAGQPGDEAAAAARVLRASVGATTPGDLVAATRPIGLDLAALTRGEGLLDRVPGIRRTPFRTRVFEQTAGAVARFLAPGDPAPVFGLAFDAAQGLPPTKLAAIVCQSEELMRVTPQLADSIVPADVAAACVAGTDRQFTDVTLTPTDDAPGFIGHDAAFMTSTGAGVAQIDHDLRAMLKVITDAGHSLRTACWIASSRSVGYLATLRSGDALAFPGVTASGGALLGLPLLASPQVPISGSPAETTLVLVVGSQVRVADDGDATFEISRSTALQLNDSPTIDAATPTAASLVSLYQVGAVAIRATRWINWKLARSDAAVTLLGVQY